MTGPPRKRQNKPWQSRLRAEARRSLCLGRRDILVCGLDRHHGDEWVYELRQYSYYNEGHVNIHVDYLGDLNTENTGPI